MTLPVIICSFPWEDRFTFSEDTHAHMFNENSFLVVAVVSFSTEEIFCLLKCENVSSFRAKNTFQSSSKVDMPSEIVNSQSFFFFFFFKSEYFITKIPLFSPRTVFRCWATARGSKTESIWAANTLTRLSFMHTFHHLDTLTAECVRYKAKTLYTWPSLCCTSVEQPPCLVHHPAAVSSSMIKTISAPAKRHAGDPSEESNTNRWTSV